MACCGCLGVVEVGEAFFECSVEACNKLYHQACTKSPHKVRNPDTWLCPECRLNVNCERKACGCGASVSAPNVTMRRSPAPHSGLQLASPAKSGNSLPVPKLCSCYHTETDEVMIPGASLSLEMRSLRQEITSLREQLKNALAVIIKYETKLEDCVSSMESLHSKFCQFEASSTTAYEPERHRVDNYPSQAILVQGTREANETYASKTKSRRVPVTKIVAQHPDGITSQKAPGPSTSSLSVVVDNVIDTSITPLPDQRGLRAKPRRHTSLRGTAGPDVTTLKAVIPRKHIHLWNMESTADEIREYLRNLCPNGTCTVEELSPRGDYKSYKIGVPEAYFGMCLSIDIWPVNARLKQWIQTKKKPERPLSTLPFREADSLQQGK